MQAAEVCNVGKEQRLLLRDLGFLRLRGGAAHVYLVDELDEGVSLVARLVGDLQDGGEPGFCHELVDGHGGESETKGFCRRKREQRIRYVFGVRECYGNAVLESWTKHVEHRLEL